MSVPLTVYLRGVRSPEAEAFAARLTAFGAETHWLVDAPAPPTAALGPALAGGTARGSVFTFAQATPGGPLVVSAGDGITADVADPDAAPRLLLRLAVERGQVYHALLEAMPDGLARIHRDGTYLFVKAASGYDSVQAPERLMGRSVYEVLSPALADHAMHAAHTALRNDRLEVFEYEVEVDGRTRRRESRVIPSGPDEVVAIMRDVTEQRVTQEHLAQREAQLRALFEHSPDAIVVLAPDGLVLDANPAACALHGVDYDDLVGQPLVGRVPEALHGAVVERLGALVSGAIPYVEAVVLGAGGAEVPVEIRGSRVAYGAVPAVLLHVRDVSARRRSEEAARQHLALLRHVVGHAPVILFALDRTGLITLAEGRGLDAFGDRAGSALGTSALDRFRRLRGFEAAVREAMNGADVARAFRLGGRSLECRFSPDGAGGVIGVSLDLTDVLAAKEEAERLSAQLRDLSARQAEEQEAERTRIAREVHDVLGQSLTALRLNASRLEAAIPDPEPIVRAGLDLMKTLVDETIQAVRRVATDLRPGMLDDLGLAATLQWTARDFTARSGLPFTLEPVEHGLDVQRDQGTALYRVFQEILTNVVRHAGATRVEGSFVEEDGAAVLRVRDDGRGIRPDDLARTDSLGLLGMRERLRVWGGTIDFHGDPGAGTTVTVRLPLARLAATAPDSNAAPRR